MLNPSGDNLRPHSLRPRKRTTGACQSCHARKVRCSLPLTGSPCMNCSLDRLVCEPRVTKRRRIDQHALPTQDTPVVLSSAATASAVHRTDLEDSNSTQTFNIEIPDSPENLPHLQVDSDALLGSVYTNGDGSETPYRPLTEHFSHHGMSAENGLMRADIENRYSPIYGDPRGVALVADICEPGRRDKSDHFLVPPIRPPHVDADTINYLRLRGVFELPSPEVCEMLIRTYFYYVHPFFPVVEAKSFIEKYESPLRSQLSIQLLWSMFLAAANFVDDATLEATNFASRKDMKRSMYTKAKNLYDAEYERSKITLIQAVLVIGFWYADTEDRTGPWHWNGIAIGLCQTIGLHRDPDTSSSHVRFISVRDRKLWRQLWWSCFYREAWFSAGMGRPMRIHLADCNTPIPEAYDSEGELVGLNANLRHKYLPEDLVELSKMWIQLLNLTVILSSILLQQHRVERVLPGATEIKCTEDKIRACYSRINDTIGLDGGRILSLYTYHMELYVESVFLILYRPFLLAGSIGPSSNGWTSLVERKTRSAATTTNRILSNMISADMINVCQSMICIALVPTLQIHLLDYTSQKEMVKRMAHQHLQLCMIVIEELKKTLFGAEILYRMFTKAQKQIRDRSHAAISALPANPLGDVPESSNATVMGDMGRTLNDLDQSPESDYDILSAIWNSFSPMNPFDYLDETE
ncbi:putative fungal-specific transcription factor [Dendryphion nanum]|uniref:Fungal-specific transcription factor n=1 Tax=Dendryphion nanum TaxID=256645 RepID=A0A9P9I822_9PLEO|nr:putative fungal-specific transcription factor [Dendryphion nanum]